MVLPLVDEDRPKCYLCHEGFESIESMREHQQKEHKDMIKGEDDIRHAKQEPAPGDVTVF